MNMVDIFEEQFGRPLTPMEFDSKEWVQSGYSEEIILKL
ncbi:MAG: DnaD domain protein [Faecalibacillus faecis]